MSNLVNKFKTDTKKFMQRYAVLPAKNNEPSSESDYSLIKITNLSNKVTHAKFDFVKKIVQANEIGALAINAYEDTGLNIFYLPWKGEHIASMNLQSPSNIRYFFTAAINGCSVFVTGTPQNPTVYHAGIGTDLKADSYSGSDSNLKLFASNRNAPAFWRQLFKKLCPTVKIKAEVNKLHYVNDGTQETDAPKMPKSNVPVWDETGKITYTSLLKQYPHTTRRAFQFKKKLKNSGVDVQLVLPWGCFWGIKKGAINWTFYLQENVTVHYVSGGRKAASFPLAVHQVFPPNAQNKWITIYTRNRGIPTHTTRRIQTL